METHTLAAGMLAAGLLTAAGIVAAAPVRPAEPTPTAPITSVVIGAVTLTPCPTEDSPDCYWNAQTMGNGRGESFVTVGGVTYYPEGNAR